MPDKPVLEIFSDFTCTWCYFDKPVITKLQSEYEISIKWRAFPLRPDIPDKGIMIEELFGNNIEMMTERIKTLETQAYSLGLPLAERTHISNSRLSHELAKWAEAKGKLDNYHNEILKAYFVQGRDIGEINVLMNAVKNSGLSKDEALRQIEKKAYSQAVNLDWKRSEQLGIIVAPTYILNTTKLPGSQSYEKLKKLLSDNCINKKIS